MCGRHRQVDEPSNKRTEMPEGAYEGETVRLGTYLPFQGTQRKQLHHCGGFPWWTLWLIWPLFGLIKGLLGVLGASATALFVALPNLSLSISIFWPVALIVVGLLLWRRR